VPRVFVTTGPSGAGKGTLEQALIARLPHELALAVSATTRARRRGEQDGREYYFLSDEEFDRRIAAGDFLEYVTYVSGQRYGTLRSELDRIAASGRAAVLDLEIEGALVVRDTVPGAATIFVDAPLEELERRLRARATESAGEIGERVELAREQRRHAHEFDHVVVNDDLSRAADELAEIVAGELAGAGTMGA
jgi:guanylate kinase